jgi:GT2 family glycosyltransferase
MMTAPNNLPLVSIAIPTYQGEEYLSETLTCAISQSYPNIEILISDDGSIDQTLEIAQEFKKKSPYDFKILDHPRLGMVENWNHCIELAQGKYIKFLFQDDLIVPNCIENMVNLAEQNPEIGLVFSPRRLLLVPGAENDLTCMYIYQGCDDLYRNWSNLQKIQSGFDLLNDPNLLEHPMNKIGEPSTVLIKKDAFERVGMFDPNLRQIVDVDMWLRIMGSSSIGFIEEKLSSFRIHPKQQSSLNQSTGESLLDFYRFCHKILTNPCYNFMPEKAKQKIYEQRVALIESEKAALQKENLDFKTQLLHEQAVAMKLEYERVKAENELVTVQTHLHQAKAYIEGMESSKFWKMRTAWFNLKRLLHLPIEE